MTYRKSKRCSGRTGLTLVEVVAAIGLLSTMLVGVLVSFSRHQRQIERSRDMLTAVELTDELLYEWTLPGEQIPAQASGEFGGREQLYWQTESVSSDLVDKFGVEIVRLSVRHRDVAETLLSIDLVVPSADWPIVAHADRQSP